MKKIILYLVMGTTILGAQLVDGYYSVQGEKYHYGWLSTASITVEDGEIVEITTNKVNKEGDLVTEDAEYNKKMLAKSGVTFKEFSVEGPKNLMAVLKGNRDTAFHLPEIDIVAGATSSSKKFKKMMEFLVEKAESGEAGKYRMKL
ncbi:MULTISPECIES: FMN-binding protein [Psychrilyobacter]|uniref:FMN-binding protein n=1 Tax=Psychrilyobacter piezotolerans TaxID=2293438 RepID=A0ABX9KGR1_9FUSO|nr:MULTISPECIES: FMN-binding protein [Psychrilyobacter]MCS5420473.1 FMN-binding protein [Psychrilyobacter sp. S5]NDI78251.1 FMN-binding protein [Psychrilyobacter piezotolerans]RDE61190.1 FMN-binding protein [Psychrilyobacter sp. S5]REI40858.1 FMN-binding protein [Psychrilyobacter piezotolerans]